MKVYYYTGVKTQLDVYDSDTVCDVFSSFDNLIEGLKEEYKKGKIFCEDKKENITVDEFHVDSEQEIAYVSIECEDYFQLDIGTSFKTL